VSSKENQDTACDICGYIPEHFHTFEEGWTSDENGHWHKATCEHDTVKNGEAAHDGYESDGVCDTCGFMVFRMYTVTVDAPDYVKVMSPDGVSGNSFAVRENTEFTFTFILPESAELVELTGGELVGEPVQENRKLTYTVRVPALNGDKTLTVAAVNYSAVEVIVENGTVSLAVEEAFKYAFADVVFDAPEAGKYMIFSPSHSDVPFGIGEMGAVLLCVFFTGTTPLLAVHMLAAMLLGGAPLTAQLAYEPPDIDIMRRAPRRKKACIPMRDTAVLSAACGAIIAIMTVAAYVIGKPNNVDAGRTMAFGTLCFSQILCSVSLRSDQPLWLIGLRSNMRHTVPAAVCLVLVALVMLLGQELFLLVDLTAIQWLIMVGLSAASLLLNELTKLLRPLLRQLAGLPEW